MQYRRHSRLQAQPLQRDHQLRKLRRSRHEAHCEIARHARFSGSGLARLGQFWATSDLFRKKTLSLEQFREAATPLGI